MSIDHLYLQGMGQVVITSMFYLRIFIKMFISQFVAYWQWYAAPDDRLFLVFRLKALQHNDYILTFGVSLLIGDKVDDHVRGIV